MSIIQTVLVKTAHKTDIQRTFANRRRCAFPGCENRDRLHDISRRIRFKTMKQKRIFIPNKARACDHHLHAWDTVDGNTGQLFSKFSKNQIEDMVELLCYPDSKITPKLPG